MNQRLLLLICFVTLFVGCKKEESTDKSTSTPAVKGEQSASAKADASDTNSNKPAVVEKIITPTMLHDALLRANPDYQRNAQFHYVSGKIIAASLQNTAISDISPLKDVPLTELHLTQSNVTDLTPLKELPLKVLSLAATKVKDLSPIKGMNLTSLDLSMTQVSDLSPIEGMKLTHLYLERTQVADLSPIKGMPIQELYISETPIRDISAVRGMPLKQLNMIKTGVQSIAALENSPVNMLWLSDTQVTDLSPLKSAKALISLTLENTPISNIESLKEVKSLQRLHIGSTNVTDLRPITGLPLTRIVFDPSKIKQGMAQLREIQTLTQMGDHLERCLPPQQFWLQYQAGGYNVVK